MTQRPFRLEEKLLIIIIIMIMIIITIIILFFKTGVVRFLKTLEFQESDFKASKVLEFRFRSLKVLEFLLNKIEKYLLLRV